MRRTAIWTILIVAAAALLLAILPATPARATVEKDKSFPVMYKIRFTVGSNTVSVEMKYEPVGDGGFGNDLYRQGALPADYFKINGATGANGDPVAISWDVESSVWRLSSESEVTVSYDIDLASLNNQPEGTVGFGNPAFSPLMPHWDEYYYFLPGEYLLLNPFTSSANEHWAVYSSSFDLPEGWDAWPSWDVAGTDEGRAVRGGVFAGKATAVEASGNIPLTVVQPQDADPANLAGQQEFAEKLAAQVNMANDAWGDRGLDAGRLTVFLGSAAPDSIDNQAVLSIPGDPLYGYAFIPVGASENILSTDFLLRAGDEALRVLLGPLAFDDEALWFREGCIHYSNLRFAQRNQWISEDDVFDQLGTDYAIYVDSLAQSGTSLAGAGSQALQESMADLLYGGGTIAVTSIDVKLAEKGKSLDEFVAGLLQESPGDGITNQYLQDELKTYSGEDFSAFFNDYITGTRTIPASSFSQLKLDKSESSETGTTIGPAPAFGRKWVVMAIAIVIVFAIPFLLEPYALHPRGGAVTLTEEEAEAESRQRKKAFWGGDDDDRDEDTGTEES